ncbi:DUF4142 domain-containing protein [Piscinibacter koreensis]|uniref:DUF4142 domain-containing protein n=1 Tax=Piscinibacter koreensis TaxID=2742824 RepID=A0A7Y6TX08_9BURK|nr:DUF4142 domain-containing protein [Schlegelella koreensis]NUZ06633.1 DUF4142 domain-containing protein [Schlegelella koreensis]
MSRSFPTRASLAAALLAAGLVTAQAQPAPTTTTPSATTPTTAANSGSSGTASGSNATSGAARGAAVPAADRRFVEKAAMGGMAEVELGRLAQQKAQNDQVKQFGQRMVDDHSRANSELMQIATGKGMQPPTTLDKKAQSDRAKLEKLSGADFDRQYMAHMLADHKKDIAEFQKEAKSGRDADIKAFAAKTLPTLQDHLKLAQTTHAAVRGGAKGNAKH